MEQIRELFKERITISGMANPVCFTFRLLKGGQSLRYKVRALSPECDFNMETCYHYGTTTYQFSDENDLPGWLKKDSTIQDKLSAAITC